ncbi:MAG: hypothetical protein Q8P18_22030 [Pseudomonadota bacterium]|nr:hypothetical protein [Pseudomonadota bacterium]
MILSLLFSAQAASPATLPVWRWPAGVVQRFHIETEIVTPTGHRYYAANNLDARAGAVKLRADAACTAKPEGKVQIVSCTFAYFDMKGQAWVADEATKLATILEEWSSDLGRTSVEMELGPDGRLRTFDTMAGKERSNKREGYIIEQERMLLQRAFSAFDLPLTTDDKDWVRGWQQKGGSALMQLLTISGTAGASEIKHTHVGERDGLTVIQTTAKGTLSAGSALDADAGGRLVDVRLAGETLFDVASGMMIWRDFTMDGRLMVSAQGAGTGAEYFQVGAIQWVPEFPAPGEIPLSVAAMRAPRLSGVAPAAVAGIAVVSFAELGMDPLFVQGFPSAAEPLNLPVTKVSARVLVNADGVPSSVTPFAGFEALGAATEQALLGARFPARPAPYSVDLDVEWRPAADAE